MFQCISNLRSHSRQAKALEPFVKKAKSLLPLNPAAKPLVTSLAEIRERNSRWKLVINDSVEFDSLSPERIFRLGVQRLRGLSCGR